ncbi:hypothetical protein Sps_02830 [Shewanella psychrophila]|uniref:Uncharacterized protein n=1 Tax=Shewanella psychrophila TaxID=225848 RepID=A0A1S6HR51_9GAMM|nr:hypothetical protein [Shewanella psychrophila]AQS37982.1 hypothetical protein Sps_02830 [Shewanella psychrophila]
MQYRIFAIFSTLLLSFSLSAKQTDQYICSLDNQQRVIEVIYTNPTAAVPCLVKYHKDNASQILWRAENQAGYCEAKANEFAIKQQIWGWQCQHITETSETVPESPQLESE